VNSLGSATTSRPGAGTGVKLQPQPQPPEILLQRRRISLPEHLSQRRERAVLVFGGDAGPRASIGRGGSAVSREGLATGVRSQGRPRCAVRLGLPSTALLPPRAAGVAGDVSRQQVSKTRELASKKGFLIFGRPP